MKKILSFLLSFLLLANSFAQTLVLHAVPEEFASD